MPCRRACEFTLMIVSTTVFSDLRTYSNLNLAHSWRRLQHTALLEFLQ